MLRAKAQWVGLAWIGKDWINHKVHSSSSSPPYEWLLWLVSVFQGGWVSLVPDANKQVSNDMRCNVEDFDELKEAVEVRRRRMIGLTKTSYYNYQPLPPYPNGLWFIRGAYSALRQRPSKAEPRPAILWANPNNPPSLPPSLLLPHHPSQGDECPTVVLTSMVDGAYDIEEEIIVTRRVTVMGSPATMPVINAGEASRAFRVKVSLPNWLKLISDARRERDRERKKKRRDG